MAGKEDEVTPRTALGPDKMSPEYKKERWNEEKVWVEGENLILHVRRRNE